MLRADDPHFLVFGEIYFASVYEGVVKGWHKHRDMTLNYACMFGRIKLALYDDRPDSETQRNRDGGFSRAGQPLARRHPARGLDRVQGNEPPVRPRRQLLHPPPRSRAGRRGSTRSTTTFPYDWAVQMH